VALDERAGALEEHPIELGAGELERPALARAGRDAARDLVDELLLALAELGPGQRQRKQPHAAVDVVAHAAGRHDAVGQRRRSDGADREAVALVDVGHRHRRLDDPRQRRDVLQLLERVVALDRAEQALVGEDARGHAHVRARVGADLPDDLADALEPGHQTSRTTVAR
jgi:hypothetical protein